MTEYWKSNAKKFCEICKCWFADNRVSIEHHESGVRHKNAVQNKLRQLGQQSRSREEEDRNLRATLASMEVAALGSFKRDLKGEPSLAQQYNIQGSAMRIPVREAAGASGPSMQVQRTMGPTITPSYGATANYGGAASASYASAPSHTASFDKVAMEMSRRVELAKKGKIPLANDRSADFSQPSVDNSEQSDKTWVEAVSPEGDTYYWHIHSGDTTWEPPEVGYLLAEEYEAMLATQGALDDAEEYASAPPLNPAIKQPEPIVPPNIATLDDDERAEAVAAAEEEDDRGYEEGEEFAGGQKEEEKEKAPEEPKLTGCFVPGAVSYYTAHAVKPAPLPLPSFNPWAAAPAFDIPPPPDEEPPMTDVNQSVFASESSSSLPPAPLDELLRKRRAEKNGGEGRVKKEPKEEPQEEEPHELPEEKLKRLVREDPVKPFGGWTVVTKAEAPEKVDLELPDASVRNAAEPAVTLQPEERVRFKEKTVASISRKKANTSDTSAPIEFKKRKTGARSLRSKDDNED